MKRACTRRLKPALYGVVVCALGAAVYAQQRGGTPQTDKQPPVNSGANPYRVVRDWAQLNLENRPWGGSNGVAIDRDGRTVWAVEQPRLPTVGEKSPHG